MKPRELYIATDGTFAKIGISVWPERRVFWLRPPGGTKVQLVQAWALPNASEIEMHIKRILRPYLIAGQEWFSVTLCDMLELVEYLLAIFDHSRPRPKFPRLMNG